MEESRTDLESYGEDEQDQAEFFHESNHERIRTESEMTEQDGKEEYPGGTDGDTLDLETGQIQAGCDNYGEKEDAVSNTCPCKQFDHNAKIPIKGIISEDQDAFLSARLTRRQINLVKRCFDTGTRQPRI